MGADSGLYYSCYTGSDHLHNMLLAFLPFVLLCQTSLILMADALSGRADLSEHDTAFNPW